MEVASITYYSISPRILGLLGLIHEQLGQVEARHLEMPPAELDKAYRTSIVHATLAIEGGQLAPLPVAALAEDHTASSQGPAALEALNTHRTYDLLGTLDPFADMDLRQAHGCSCTGWPLRPDIIEAARWRSSMAIRIHCAPRPPKACP
ncbi:MAG: hypothetical protein IPJ85_02630 [Flavobacteriales bacterium]|nr:hypothetical protein [Flavobacteriales bacterium]